MKNKYHIIFNLFVSILALISVQLKNSLLIISLFRGIRRKSRDVLTRIALWLLR